MCVYESVSLMCVYASVSVICVYESVSVKSARIFMSSVQVDPYDLHECKHACGDAYTHTTCVHVHAEMHTHLSMHTYNMRTR